MPRSRISIRAAVLASLTIAIASPASAASFPSVVRAVLDHQTDGRLASHQVREQVANLLPAIVEVVGVERIRTEPDSPCPSLLRPR